ncbi:MAG TPA: hypothetical protein VL053_18455 [Arachidicoccus sp.]|nr:hypothetical protein [Arachidicoccus sp.]
MYLYTGQEFQSAQFFGTSEGLVRSNATNSFFVYDYLLKDHLGNMGALPMIIIKAVRYREHVIIIHLGCDRKE